MRKKILNEKPKKEAASKTIAVKKQKAPVVEKAQVAIEALGLNNLKAPKGAHKKRKILGRGSSSGHGKTSTRGSKGQTSRSGRDFYPGFEGGQTPLIRRIAKRGFTSKFRKIYQIVNLEKLAKLSASTITLDVLLAAGIIKNKSTPVKILGDGEIASAKTVQAHAFSDSAAKKIKSAGGKTEIIE